MADISQIKLPNNTTYDVKDAKKTGIYHVKGTQTAATGSWTGNINVPALYTGLTIMYYLPYAPSGNATLNLTLSDGTTTGAKNCYYSNGRLTTHYGKGCNIIMTYYKAGDISIDGTATTDDRWVANANYTDGNSAAYHVTNYYNRYVAGANKIFPYTIIMQCSDGRWESIVTSSSTGTSKARNTHGFRLGQLAVMYNNYTYNADAQVGDNTVLILGSDLIDHRYSFNTANNSTNGTTAKKPVYLVGALNATDGLFYLDTTWWTQTLPSSADGKLYIYLGNAFDYYRMSFELNHPVYCYTNGKIRQFAQDCATVTGHTVDKDVPSDAVFTDNDTKNTAGSTDTSSKIFLIGATSQAANPQTYSQDTAYVGTNGHVYSNSKQVVNLSDSQALTNKTYNGYTLGAACAKGVDTSVTSGSANLVTSGAVYTAIDNLPEPMVFKGSLGTGGTITALPVNGTATIGDTYKVITAGTYASTAAKVGDTFICVTKTSSANTWVLIPSGDEPSGTVTSVTLKATSPIAIDSTAAITTSGTRTFSHANSGATAGSYGDSSAQTPSYGATFKVPYITVNATGHVTAISDHTVKIPASDNTNNAVTQTATTTNANYEVLFSATEDNTTRTEGARKTSTFKYNPNTDTLTVGNVQSSYSNTGFGISTSADYSVIYAQMVKGNQIGFNALTSIYNNGSSTVTDTVASTDTTGKISFYGGLKTGLIDLIYPVGSIYISVNSTNPSNFFGGTWVAFATGKTIVGVDTSDDDFKTVEKTGGAKTSSHVHYLGNSNKAWAKINWSTSNKYLNMREVSLTNIEAFTENARTSISGTWTSKTTGTGSYGAELGGTVDSTSLALMQPYITTYMWKRTA